MQWYLVILGLVLVFLGGAIIGPIAVLAGICVFCIGLVLKSKQEQYYELKLKKLKKIKKKTGEGTE